MNPDLTVIIATQGRPCLVEALKSIRAESTPEQVEIIVCGDSFEPDIRALACAEITCQAYGARFMAHNAGFHHWGHPQAQFAMSAARGDRLAFLGDDDFYLPGGLDLMRHTDNAVTLFQILNHKVGSVIWREPFIKYGDISGQNIVVRNDPVLLGIWGTGPDRGGDYQFICDTVARADGHVAWVPEVICECL